MPQMSFHELVSWQRKHWSSRAFSCPDRRLETIEKCSIVWLGGGTWQSAHAVERNEGCTKPGTRHAVEPWQPAQSGPNTPWCGSMLAWHAAHLSADPAAAADFQANAASAACARERRRWPDDASKSWSIVVSMRLPAWCSMWQPVQVCTAA